MVISLLRLGVYVVSAEKYELQLFTIIDDFLLEFMLKHVYMWLHPKQFVLSLIYTRYLSRLGRPVPIPPPKINDIKLS